MKKIILSLSIFLSISAHSQTMTIINNTSELIEIKELWTNHFCNYTFPSSIHVDEAASSIGRVAPFSAAVAFSYPPFSATGYDFEYVKLDLVDRSTSTVVLSSQLGTDAMSVYDPSSCSPPASPTTTTLSPCGFWSTGPGIPVWIPCTPGRFVTGIRQVIEPDKGNPPAPSAISQGSIINGKIYRLTWFTIWNSLSGKYDVEITIN